MTMRVENDCFAVDAKLSLNDGGWAVVRIQVWRRTNGPDKLLSTAAFQAGGNMASNVTKWAMSASFEALRLEWPTVELALRTINREFFPDARFFASSEHSDKEVE